MSIRSSLLIGLSNQYATLAGCTGATGATGALGAGATGASGAMGHQVRCGARVLTGADGGDGATGRRVHRQGSEQAALVPPHVAPTAPSAPVAPRTQCNQRT